jgi:hypothetical protein
VSFQPVVPFGGIAGWQFLKRTMDTQRAAFDAAPARQRDVDYFRERIGSVVTAEQLVGDRRLLTVALGAFGLDADIDNRFFIQKVLEEGTVERSALANKLSDSRYREMSAAFGFGNGALPRTALSGFAEEIADAFLRRQFEQGVGQSDQTMRLALTLERELPRIASRGVTDDTKWLTVMGNPPLRRVFETALGFPRSFGALELDRQLADFKDRAERVLGVSRFSDLMAPEKQDEVMRVFLARAQIAGGFGSGAGPSSPALALLRQAGGGGIAALL